jgi:hypothetical protein
MQSENTLRICCTLGVHGGQALAHYGHDEIPFMQGESTIFGGSLSLMLAFWSSIHSAFIRLMSSKGARTFLFALITQASYVNEVLGAARRC